MSLSFTGASTGAFTIGTTSGPALTLATGGSISTDTTFANIETVNAPLIIGATGAAATYTFTSGETSPTNVLNIGGTVTGAASTGNNTVLTLNGTNTGLNTVNGVISDGAAGGTLSVVKTGAGTWILKGANSYTGGTTLTLGTLDINNASALGSGLFTITAGTLDNTSGTAITSPTNNPNITWGGGNFAFSTAAGTSANSLNLGTGAVSITTTLGRSITLNGAGALTFGGLMTNGVDGAISFSVNNGAGTTSTSAVNFAGFALTGATSTAARVDTIGGTGNINFSGAITNGVSAGSGLTYTGTSGGTLTLAGNNTYTGLTTLNGIGGTVVLSGNNTSATGGITLTNGTLDVNSTTALSTGTLTISASGLIVIDNTSGTSKVETNSSSIVINGNFAFGGTNNLTLPGTATMLTSQTIALNGTGSTETMGGLNLTAASGGESLTVDGAGNTLSLGGLSLLASGSSVILTGNGNINVTGNVVSNGGASSLTYNGAGTLTLGGSANSYTGGTTLNSGMINLTGSVASGVAVSGGAFTESGTGSISTGSFSIKSGVAILSGSNNYASGTTVNGGTLVLDFSGATAPTTATNIIKTGTALTMGNGTLMIKGGGSGASNSQNLTGTTSFSGGTSSSIIFVQNGATSLGASLGAITRNAASTTDITLLANGAVTTTSTTFSSGGILTSAASNGIAFATANGGTTWLTNAAGTLGALSIYSNTYAAGNNVNVTAGDSISAKTVNTLRFSTANTDLTLTGANIVSAGGILVTPGSTGATIKGAGSISSGAGTAKELVILDYGSLNISAIIADNSTPVAVTLAGPGTTTFSNLNNSYTGVTTINGGTLILAGGSTGVGATTVNAGGTLQLANDTAHDGGLAAGTLSLSGGTLQATSAAALTVSSAVSLTANSTISGAQNLTLSTVGQTANTTLTNNIASGKTLTLGTVNIDAAATASTLTLTMNGSGNTTINSLNDFGGTSGTSHGSFTYGGSGTVTLAGTNTYGGSTSILGGTVILAGSNTASTPGAVTFGVGGAGGSLILDNTGATAAKTQAFGTLTFQGGDDTVASSRTANFDELVTFTSLAARSGGSTENFVLGGGTNSATNGFSFTTQTAGFLNQGAFFNGSNYAWYSAANSAGIVRGINYATDTAAFTTGAATTLPVNGNGATALLYAQTTGAISAQVTESMTTLNLAGTGTTAGQNDFTLASGATLSLKGILRSGNVSNSSATISGGAGIIGSSGSDLVIRTDGVNDVLTINTSILGGTTSTNAGIVKSGAGTLIMGTSAVNTYLVSTTINQGTLNVSQDSNLGMSFDSINFNAGTLQAGASFALNGTRVMTLSGNGGGQTIDTQSYNLGILGAITGGGATQTLTKIGSGALTLTSNNTYLSATVVNAGKLYVNNAGGASYTAPSSSVNRTITSTNTTGSGTGAAGVTVNSGGTLAGSGTIISTSNGVTVNSGGTLASGGIQSGTTAGAGLTINNTTARLSNALSVNAGATLTFDLGSTTLGSSGNTFANPNTNSTYLSVTGTTVDQIFATPTTNGTTNINLVDLTAGSSTLTLSLRYQNPYLLIQTELGNNEDFANLLTSGGQGQNGYILGVSDGLGHLTSFNLTMFDINGTDITTSNNYYNLLLYLNNGDIEVVPEPQTWAMMLGGLALLVIIHRRKNKQV